FLGCSPFGPIHQISRSPSFEAFVPNEMVEPSGDTAHARALSRSFEGDPPNTDTDQRLAVPEFHSFHSSVAGCALARKRALFGNQTVTTHFTFRPFSSSGSGILRVSPVSISVRCIPFLSL